jgi:outer membrane protein TolC
MAAQQSDDSPKQLPLSEAVRLAQLNSPLTVGARNALRTGKLTELNALGQFMPNLGINYNASNFAGSIYQQGQLLPYTGNPWNYGKGYSANILLFDGGQRYFGYKQAIAGQRANEENETVQRYGVAAAVKQQYFAVLQARELEAAGASALELAQAALNASSAKVKIGQVFRTDSLKAAIQVGSAQLQLLNARAALRDANAALTRLVASSVPVTAITSDTADVPRIDVDDASLARMADDGPLVRQAIAAFDAAKQGKRSTLTSQYIPQVRASYSYNASGFTSPTFNWGGGPPSATQTQYAFSVGYTIFNGFSRELGAMQATVAADNAEAALRDARFNAKSNLAAAADRGCCGRFYRAAVAIQRRRVVVPGFADSADGARRAAGCFDQRAIQRADGEGGDRSFHRTRLEIAGEEAQVRHEIGLPPRGRDHALEHSICCHSAAADCGRIVLATETGGGSCPSCWHRSNSRSRSGYRSPGGSRRRCRSCCRRNCTGWHTGSRWTSGWWPRWPTANDAGTARRAP